MRLNNLMMRLRRRFRRKFFEWLLYPLRLRNAVRLSALRRTLGDSPAVKPAGDVAPSNRKPSKAATPHYPGQAEASPTNAETSQPNYEAVIDRVYRDLLRMGDTAVDVGANFGIHTLGMAERVYPTGCVIAFEPLPVGRAEVERLLERAARGAYRKVVVLSPYALSNQAKDTEFNFAPEVPGWSGLKQLDRYARPVQLEKIPVRVERLDTVLADVSRCRFMKIDVEGGELDALRGGEGFLRRCRPVVAFEFGAYSCTSYGVKPIDMARFWESLNYRLIDVKGRLLTCEEFARSAEIQEVWDYFAVPNERQDLQVRVQQLCRGSST